MTKEILILAAVFITSSVVGKLFLDHRSQVETQTIEDLNYEMPRPESFRGQFSLDGREVDEETINPNKKIEDAKLVKTTAAADKAKVAAKKDDKTKKKTAAVQKKKQLKISVTDTRGQLGLRLASGFGQDQEIEVAVNTQSNIQPTELAKQPKKEEKKESIDWRSLLFDQSDLKTANDFIQAYRKGDVDRSAFFAISREMLLDGNKSRHDIGLYLLKANPSVESFVMLSEQMSKMSDGEKQVFQKENLDFYSQPTYFSVLAGVLNGKSKEVTTESIRLINIAVRNAGNPGSTAPNRDPRSLRTFSETGPGSKTQLTLFVPSLTVLAQDEDPTFSSEAQQILDRIQSLLTA